MILGISEDFTSNVILDSELTAIPKSGMYLNSGVHPSITVQNLLDSLPKLSVDFSVWNETNDYNSFLSSKNRQDIVKLDDKIYQSIKSDNTGNNPTEENSKYWVETNMESLRLKIFIEKVKDRVYSDLSLTKRLVNNQYLYTNNDKLRELNGDYRAWVIEPKGSDYVSFRINQMSIQKDGTIPINVYIIHQNTLKETITISPNNGELSFVDTDIVLSGKGSFKIAIDSQEVYSNNVTIDPLKFNGFVAYTAIGTGEQPETAKYVYNTYGFGLGLNISAYLDANTYIENNLSDIAGFVRSTFELMTFEMFLHNSHNTSNRSQRIQLDKETLMAELKDMRFETVIKRYHRELKRVKNAMQKTFDTQLNDHDGIEISTKSV